MPGNPWDQRENETDGAYRAFLIYRDLGESRSLDAVGYQISEGTKEKQKRNKRARGLTGTVGRWSTNHEWVSRAAAWDAHQESERQKGREQAAREQGELWERRRHELAERNWNDAHLLAMRAKELAEMPVIARREDKEKRVIFEPIDAKMLRDAAVVMETAGRLARESILGGLGLDIPVPRPRKPIDQMSTDELKQYLQELQEPVAGPSRGRVGTAETDGRRQ